MATALRRAALVDGGRGPFLDFAIRGQSETELVRVATLEPDAQRMLPALRNLLEKLELALQSPGSTSMH